MRINSEHAVDAANHPASRSANNPTNKATDRSEHAVTGISTAVSPVVHPPRHALRLCGDRRGEKEGDSNHTEHSHLVSLFSLDELLLRREFPLYQDPDHVGDLFAAHRTPGLQADVQIDRHVDRFMGQPMTTLTSVRVSGSRGLNGIVFMPPSVRLHD
jgi:hypothetical protein